MNELTKALADTKPTLVEFYSPAKRCCVATFPVVDELRARVGDKANIVQIIGPENEDLVAQYKVASYPCWILFKDGQEAWRDYGTKPFGELEHMIRSFE